MALYKTSLDIVVKHSRLFSFVAQKTTQSWFGKVKTLPVFDNLEYTANLNDEQWTNLRTEILKSQAGIKPLSLDVTILQVCIASKNLDLGKSYLKYLDESKFDINIAVIGKYFQLFYNTRDSLTDGDKNEILSRYDELRLKHPLLDAVTAESCILAISLTDRWKETIELLEMVQITCAASSPSYSAIIVASFNNGEPETGWKYLNEMVKLKKIPHSDTYIAYINNASKNIKEPDACVEEIGKLFQFIAEHDLIPFKIVMDEIKRTFERLGWVATFSKLSSVGVCRNCNHQLEPLKLSENDFSHLSKTVLDKVLVGSDVYFKSTPVELKKFVKFVDKTKPYDIVIDGLNVGYKNKKHSASNAARPLAAVVRYFFDKNYVILVLGRKHMLRWEQTSMNYIKNNSFLFLTDNLSSDDPCLLYATLASGADAKFVSSDLMRQHKFILRDISLERMFKRWQMSHQCFMSFNKDKLRVVPPLNFLPVAQKGENCWHVPYRLADSPLTESYEPPSDWLCLEKKSGHCE